MAVNNGRSRRWSCAGAQRYSVPPSAMRRRGSTCVGGDPVGYTGGSAKGSSTVSAVVYTELRCRSSLAKLACAAWFASLTPTSSSSSRTSDSSCVSTHRTTSDMSPPPVAAANSSGASSLAAVAYQKSPSVIGPLPPLAPSVSDTATLRAPDHVRAASNGDHRAEGSPVEPLGSKHC